MPNWLAILIQKKKIFNHFLKLCVTNAIAKTYAYQNFYQNFSLIKKKKLIKVFS